MGNGTDVKIKWNHCGLKHKIIISQAEIANDDLYEVLLRKIRQQRPEFDGMLAYFDSQGNQVIFASDKELREIIRHNKGRIKIYTIRPPPRNNELIHPKRSQSVPLEYRSRFNPSQRPPSTLQDAPPPYYGRYGGYLMNSLSEIRFPIAYPQVPPPGYTYTYTTYTPYGQSIMYGLPPRSMMMRSFLCSPFPFGGYHRSWVGGPKFYGYGGWGGQKPRGLQTRVRQHLYNISKGNISNYLYKHFQQGDHGIQHVRTSPEVEDKGIDIFLNEKMQRAHVAPEGHRNGALPVAGKHFTLNHSCWLGTLLFVDLRSSFTPNSEAPGVMKSSEGCEALKASVNMLRRPGIGPGPPAWQASILPLNHRRWFRSEVLNENGFSFSPTSQN
uniref:PB1 domain-containing protein n=1 Tax=Ascaris lumbricoides TaxID=6252 RepID=A0A9J2PKM9_ASCLU